MIQTLSKNWLLLALCGILHAVTSVIYLTMWNTNGPLTFESWNSTVHYLGMLALAAGACTIAAGTLRSTQGKCWMLVLNGFALGALGALQYAFVRFRISFLTVALLITMMAISMGILELIIARSLRRHSRAADAWSLGAAGVASVAFALAFLALGFQWVKIAPGSHLDLLWLGCYFGFTAICMLGLALRLQSQTLSQSGLPPLGNPSYSH